MKLKQKHIIFIGILFYFIVGIFYLFFKPVSAASELSSYIGIIKVPPKETPAKCYKIVRDGKEFEGRHNMPVYVGDKIQFFCKEKKVRLIYVRTDWGELEITQNMIVAIPEKMIEMAKGKITPVKIATTRHDEKDTSCFPSQQFNISPFPPNNTTVLSNEPLLFRWFKSFESSVSCSDALLVIMDETGKEQKIEIRLGELKSVDAAYLKPGQAYNWYIGQDGKKLSETYHFRVMNKEESEIVRRQLSEIEKRYPEQSPQLLQALFLQSVSEPLYADSLRILYQFSKKSGVPDEKVFEAIYEKTYEVSETP